MALEHFQQQVVEDKTALDEKITKLEAFFSTGIFNNFSILDQDLLYKQLHTMRLYSQVLKERIVRFGKV